MLYEVITGEVGVHVNVTALVQLDLGGLPHDGIGVGADREYHHIGRNVVFAAGYRYWATAP